MQISVIVEFVAGRVQDMLLKMIALYRPDCEWAVSSSSMAQTDVQPSLSVQKAHGPSSKHGAKSSEVSTDASVMVTQH